MAAATYSKAVNTSPYYSVQLRRFAAGAIVTLFALILAIAYLMPFGNMALVSVKTQDQIVASAEGPIWPLEPAKFTYEGEEYNVYRVPFEDGTVRELALVQKGRRASQFIDPANPDGGLIEWQGNWRGLEPVSSVVPHFENFATAWELLNFPLLFGNTLAIAIIGMIGTLLSSICVAYAFARFPIPGKNILFLVLIGTIILPGQVTLIPTYAFFARIGWVGTWLPLTVPHFFANAYNVFLLRQFFLTLPRELDEAAMIDGAGPFRILKDVIIPQSWPAIVSVGLFHFIFAWNDYFAPLIYLLGRRELLPISVGVQEFNFTYGPRPELVQATSLMAMILPLVIFFLAQRVFMRGVVITGVEK
jgi:multiple sugar transport system permease protein